MQEYEENRQISPGWSWAIIGVFCALIIAWGLVNWALIKDGPRDWDFGALPDAPSASIYSTEQAPEKAITVLSELVARFPQSERLSDALVERYGLPHDETYVDACHLCYLARAALRERWPEILRPAQMYGE